MLRASAPAIKSWRATRSKRMAVSMPLMVRRRTQASVRSLRRLGCNAVSNHGPVLHPSRRGRVAAPQDEDGECACAFVNYEGSVRNLQIVPIAPIGQCGGMFEPLLLLVAAAFLIAGFIKGVIGLGLPTVSMGLLAVSMPPAHALAIVIVPAIITNIWQTFGGPYLRDIIRRLWPLMVGTVVGIWLNAGMLTGPYARYGTIV